MSRDSAPVANRCKLDADENEDPLVLLLLLLLLAPPEAVEDDSEPEADEKDIAREPRGELGALLELVVWPVRDRDEVRKIKGNNKVHV